MRAAALLLSSATGLGTRRRRPFRWLAASPCAVKGMSFGAFPPRTTLLPPTHKVVVVAWLAAQELVGDGRVSFGGASSGGRS
jgi:hypothetical protein